MALMNTPPQDRGGSPVPTPSDAGKLPNRRPDALWAGRSAGCECAICGTPLEPDELEYELEYGRRGADPGVDTHHVHIRCFTAFIWKDKGTWAEES
jgi:hypothetical protein